ncbi:hypothetical protein [Rhodoferax sp. BAB1]|uniref:hypothetical protein n=1 Tax=Rhodoferax sp. BAB1 TaxID=2741720 RepID=UPI0015754D8E|nr:hypothetical protein [Rhodoferax sp. BAB1]QKO21292.1 hypothetical protein HTY51_05040 [Rhodoferax sp. BAB1]
MVLLLFIFAFLFFAFIAPLQTTVGLAASFLLVVITVRLTAREVSGAPASWGDALRAICLSFLFVLLAGVLVFKFSSVTGIRHFSGLGVVLLLGVFLLAYVLGLKLSLGISLGASFLVALLAAVISTGVVWVLRAPARAADPIAKLSSEHIRRSAADHVNRKMMPILAQEFPRLTAQCPVGDADLGVQFKLTAVMQADGRLSQVAVHPRTPHSACVADHIERMPTWPAPDCRCILHVALNFSPSRK